MEQYCRRADLYRHSAQRDGGNSQSGGGLAGAGPRLPTHGLLFCGRQARFPEAASLLALPPSASELAAYGYETKGRAPAHLVTTNMFGFTLE